MPRPSRLSRARTSEIGAARRARWKELVAEERKRAGVRTYRVWHQGSPSRKVLDAAAPPLGPGRYHQVGGRATWYGSSTESAAWAELARHTAGDLDQAQLRRRLGRVDYDVVALDLTSGDVQKRLGLDNTELISDDLAVCQAIADLAAQAGFDAVLGPSAALDTETTLAVFAPAITERARGVVDRGVRTPPSSR